MRFLAVLALSAALASAADFMTGQAARLVIGQSTFTAQGYGASDVLLGGVGGVAYANDMLLVTDANRVGASPINHRALIFRNLSQSLPALRGEIAADIARCPICAGRADVVLGQPDFTKTDFSLSQTGLRLPTAIATDGRVVAIADTDNNRVLIWNSIPTVNDQKADVVVGQPNFTSNSPRVTQEGMRGPQGVWIQNGKLFVADTSSDRVLIWNSIPTSNGQKADVVLGQPNFTTIPPENLAQKPFEPKATTLLSPVSVTSDGQRLFVTDLGHNRVLIWNSIPSQNQQPADVVIGQPDLTSAGSNDSSKLCPADKQDDKGNDVFPARCAATLSYPRYALSDGRRLFIADGGNDRVLVFNSVPTENARSADVILGQINPKLNQVSDSAEPLRRASSDSLTAPLSLAWDGTNLFVTDPYYRRVMVFSVGDAHIPVTGVRNSASREVYAVGSVALAGQIKEGDEITIKVGDKEYKYKIVKDDTFAKVIYALVTKINASGGDPLVFATPNTVLDVIVLTARQPGVLGNDVEYSTKTSDGAQIQATAGGAKLAGGQDAAKIGPGTLVSIVGEDFCDSEGSAPADARVLPYELAGVQVYFDGIRAPLLFVSPTQINAQVPYHVLDTNSINAYIRATRKDGSVTVTTPTAVPIIGQNPGIFAEDGVDPRPAIALHSSSYATGTVSVDGTAKAGDIATVKIEERPYSYTVKDGDTLESIRDGLIALINRDEKVMATAASAFTRIRLRARVPGPEGNGMKYSADAGSSAQVILTPTTPELCCANVAGSRITEDNPALPGETIIVYATGLGLVKPDEARLAIRTGEVYEGPALNDPVEFVSSLAGGKTANVLSAGLKPEAIGIYEVHLELNSDLPTNPATQVTIAQDVYVSNIVTLPLFNPAPAEATTP